MATACRLAAEAGAAVVGVSAIYVPVREPLDVAMPEREAEVSAVQAMAASLADEYGVEYRPVVERTRSPGRLVVDAAVEHRAGLIVGALRCPLGRMTGSPEARTRSSSGRRWTSSCERRRAGS